MTPILELEHVSAGYGGVEALRDVDLTVPSGGIFAILGPNGAGRTTMMSVIAGLHPVAAGRIRFDGVDVTGWRGDRLARRGLCLVPEGRGIFPNLTVRENLRMVTYAGTATLEEVEAVAYARFPRLADRRSQVAGTLSGGEQQMLALARGLATEPALLMLDELSMGLAPLIVEELYAQVAAIAATGVSIVVVEQFARTVLGVADLAAVLVQGRVTAIGPPEEIEADLTSAYLGHATHAELP